MKVLITGSYSYAGIKLSDKFTGEKHQVTVIDNPGESKESRLALKHRFYNMNAWDPECRKVFESSSFDIVIFISPGFSMQDNDSGSADMRSIVNIASLSAETGVKKFILLTHVSVYGADTDENSQVLTEDLTVKPRTYRGMADSILEYYAIKICAGKKIPVLCLRLSEIYGPLLPGDGNGFAFTSAYTGKENIAEMMPGDAVSFIAANTALKNKLPGIKNHILSHDYIYIEDAVSAVYKAALKKDLSGIFNVSSHTVTPMRQIIDILAELQNIKHSGYTEKRDFENGSPQVSNSKLKNAIDWQPSVALEEGLKRCMSENKKIRETRGKNKKSSDGSIKQKKASKGKGQMFALAVFENLFLFFIFAFLQWGELFFNIKLPAAVIDYSIVYIIIVAVIWGQVQAYIAMLLSSILFLAVSILTGTDIVTFIYTPENLVRLAVYLLVGIITGYAIERRNRAIETKETAFIALSSKYSFLLEIYNQTKTVKNELENQVISTEDSFSAIYEAIRKVESLEIEEVYSGAINAIEKIMKTDSVSIYTGKLDGRSEYMRLKARSAKLAGLIPNSVNTASTGHFRYVLEKNCMYINRDFIPSAPLMMAPVTDGGRVIAVISLHSAEFENLTSHYENLYLTVINLVTGAIKRAYYFEDSLKDKKYIKGTNILNAESFDNVLTAMKKYKDELGMGFSMLSVSGSDKNLEDISASLSGIIRENDYAGVSEDENIYIILSNTENDNAHIVIDRLKEHGIYANLVTGEDEHE